MLGRKLRLNYLAILLLSACLPHTGEVKREDEGYWLDVSKLGYASVRYRASGGDEKILHLNIARMSLQGKSVAVAALADPPQLLQAGSDSKQELPEIKLPVLAVEKFYMLSEVAFYMQSNDSKKYFCQLKDVPLGSKYSFSLTSDACKKDGGEPERVYFYHEYGDAKHKLSEKILQIDCEVTYGDKQQLLRLAVHKGTIIDDKGSYAFAKQEGEEFKLKCWNNFSYKLLWLGQEELKKRESKSVEIKNVKRLACFRFSDGWLLTPWDNVSGKVAAACKEEEELLKFNFSDEDPTRNGILVPSYLSPDTMLVKDVKDDTPLKDIYVLSRCDNCVPDWVKQVHCAAACQAVTLAYPDEIVAPGTVVYAGAREHYSQRLFCPGNMQTLADLNTNAALTCLLTKKDDETTEQQITLTGAVVRGGKVCIDFTPEKTLTISAATTCDSKLRFFFKAVNKHK